MIDIKPLDRDDGDQLAFVLDSWRRAHGDWQRRSGEVERVDYPDLVQRSRVLVAHAAEVDGVYIGWSCGDDDALHYVFVKKPYRRLGIAKRLIMPFSRATSSSCRGFLFEGLRKKTLVPAYGQELPGSS